MAYISNIKTAFTAGEIAPALYGHIDLAKNSIGCKLLKNCIVEKTGGASNRAGTEFIMPLIFGGSAEELIPFVYSKSQTYMLLFTNSYVYFINDGKAVITASSGKAITGITNANPCVITCAAHGYSVGDYIYIYDVEGMQELNKDYYKITAVTTNTITIAQFSAVDSTGFNSYTGGGYIDQVYQLASPYSDARVPYLKYQQSGDVLIMVDGLNDIKRLTRIQHNEWAFTDEEHAPSIATPTNLTLTDSHGSDTDVNRYLYKVTAVSSTGEESLPAEAQFDDICVLANDSDSTITLTWDAVTDAVKYNVYRDRSDSGSVGWIGDAEATASPQFVDGGVNKFFAADMSDTPPRHNEPYADSDEKPALVAFHEERIAYGKTEARPQHIGFSQIGNFSNFAYSTPYKDDDSIDLVIPGLQGNTLKYMISTNDVMLIFTEGMDWIITPDGNAFTQGNISIRKQSTHGASDVPPIVIEGQVLYIQAFGSVVYEKSYSDAAGGYVDSEKSVLAEHLFKGRSVVDWTYQEYPNSVIWCAMSDGTMIGLTYTKEHDIYAWHRHETDGEVQKLESIPESNGNRVYMIVEREGNKYIERMNNRDFETVSDCFFVDAGVTVEDGAGITDVYVPAHLEGRTVAILADGNNSTQVVSNRKVTLNTAANKIHVGLPYESKITPLPLVISQDTAGGQAMTKRVGSATIRLLNSRNFQVVDTDDTVLYTHKESQDVWGSPIEPVSQDVDVNVGQMSGREGVISITQTYPLPLTVTAIITKERVSG